jgi:hypothetical protein
MEVVAPIVAAVVLFVGGFVACYIRWHRSEGWAFEKVPVTPGRSVHVLRQGVTLEGRPD